MNLRKGFANLSDSIIPCYGEDPVNGWGQNIPLVTNTRSGWYEKVFFKDQSCTCLCKSPDSDEARWSTREKARNSHGGFHRPLGLKNNIQRGSRKTQWTVQVVRKSFIQSSKNAGVYAYHPTQMKQSNQNGRRPGTKNIYKGKGF